MPRIAALVVTVVCVCLFAASPAHAGKDACKNVARDAQHSCLNDAQASYWTDVARCDNQAAGVKACSKDAKATLHDDQSSCDDQLKARKQICEDLGGGIYAPVIDPAHFVGAITNPLSPMVPGTTFVYEGETPDGHEHEEVFVTHHTRVILGVTCIEVRDTSTIEGALEEDTLDWFAQDDAGNVWYFGEESKQFHDGVLVGVEGSWMAGVDSALPGIVMEASPTVGDVYRQEFSTGTAEDMAAVESLSASGSVPFGDFSNALETREFSGLEPDALEHKFYTPGVGLVLTVDDVTGDRTELVSIETE
jgi:hypothetical protein